MGKLGGVLAGSHYGGYLAPQLQVGAAVSAKEEAGMSLVPPLCPPCALRARQHCVCCRELVGGEAVGAFRSSVTVLTMAQLLRGHSVACLPVSWQWITFMGAVLAAALLRALQSSQAARHQNVQVPTGALVQVVWPQAPWRSWVAAGFARRQVQVQVQVGTI